MSIDINLTSDDPYLLVFGREPPNDCIAGTAVSVARRVAIGGVSVQRKGIDERLQM